MAFLTTHPTSSSGGWRGATPLHVSIFDLRPDSDNSRPWAPRDQARDSAHALAWLLQQEDYNLKQDDVVALGYSSGAHLVALIGADGSLLEEAGLSETVLAATVSLDVHAYDVPYALELMVDSDGEQNMPLIRHLFGDTSTEQLASSPISYLNGFVAPALVISVDQDPAREGSHGYIVSKTAERYVTERVQDFLDNL